MTVEKIRVLVVEDDLRIADLHQRFVSKLDGFEVVGIAGRIDDAREMVEVLQPDLVLLDLFFPEGNGMELLRHIRAGDQPCDVILITAAREMTTLQNALRGGVFDYIVKPVFFPRFQESLQNFRTLHLASRSGGALEQRDIDRLLHAQIPLAADAGSMPVPKGIDPLTLNKVRQVFDEPQITDLSAEDVGKTIGASRSTARRYLEYLTTEGYLKADLIYGVVGRPERRYVRSR